MYTIHRSPETCQYWIYQDQRVDIPSFNLTRATSQAIPVDLNWAKIVCANGEYVVCIINQVSFSVRHSFFSALFYISHRITTTTQMAPICIGKQRQPSRLDFLLFSIANNFLINVPETMAALRIPSRPPVSRPLSLWAFYSRHWGSPKSTTSTESERTISAIKRIDQIVTFNYG